MKTKVRLSDYISTLKEKRNKEIIRGDEISEISTELTSPLGATSTEEIRIFNEYMEQVNLLNITKAAPEKKKKILILRKFFKMKRNQQVIIYSLIGNENIQTFGKVNAIGRDFVMVTNLNERIWLPYHFIESANIPSGIPTFSNSHQYFIYDNDLRRKLLYNFGETVANRDVLKQQFYEESFVTNLKSWRKTWVKIQTDKEILYGKIQSVTPKKLELFFLNEKIEVELKRIVLVKSMRFFNLLFMLGKKRFGQFKIKKM